MSSRKDTATLSSEFQFGIGSHVQVVSLRSGVQNSLLFRVFIFAIT